MSDVHINIVSKFYPAIERAGQHLAISDLKLTHLNLMSLFACWGLLVVERQRC